MARKLIVEVVGDASSLDRTLSHARRSLGRFGRESSRGLRGVVAGSGIFQSLGRSVAFASGAFIGGYGLTAVLRSALGEMADAQQVTAQMNAALRSTHGVANVTAGQIDNLSTSLMNLSGVDDELIQRSQALLLSFTNIRNYAGQGNRIFTLATKAALDMNAALGGDLQSSTIQLGKALQDPVRGITALRRVGISFSDEQRKMIKNWVEHGDILRAQRLILREISTEFGGVAASIGRTPIGRLRVLQQNVINVAGAVAEELTPQINHATNRAIRWIRNTENQKRVEQAFRDVASAVGTIAGKIADVVGKLGGWKNALTIAAGAWVGFKLAGIGSATAVLFANTAAAEGVAAAWKAALISTGWGTVAVAAGIAAAYIVTHWEKVKTWFAGFWIWLKESAVKTALKVVEPFSHLPFGLGGWAQSAKRSLKEQLAGLEQEAARVAAAGDKAKKAAAAPEEPDMPRAPRLPTFRPGRPTAAARQAAAERRRAAEQARIERLQFAVDQARATRGLADDLRALLALQAHLKRQLQVHRGNLDLRRQLLDVEGQINDVVKQQAEQRQAARARRQFGALGLGPTGEELVPRVRGLRRHLLAVRQAIAGTFLDTRRTRSLLANIQRVLSGQLGAVGREVRQKVAEILNDFDRQLREREGGLRTRWHRVSTRAMLGGLGLTPEQAQALQLRLAQRGPGGVVPGGRQPAFAGAGGGVVVNGNVSISGVQNWREFESAMTKRQGQRPQVRRGAR